MLLAYQESIVEKRKTLVVQKWFIILQRVLKDHREDHLEDHLEENLVVYHLYPQNLSNKKPNSFYY
jgi:hypothetical protein